MAAENLAHDQMETFTIERWCDEIAEQLNHPIYRHINVTINPITTIFF